MKSTLHIAICMAAIAGLALAQGPRNGAGRAECIRAG